MSPEEMDSFIFCIASKRSAQRLSKDMNDLNTYCPEKRPADKYDIPGAYFVMSEVRKLRAVNCKVRFYWSIDQLQHAVGNKFFFWQIFNIDFELFFIFIGRI